MGGSQSDLSACKAKCNSVTTCKFLSFCPSGVDCTGYHANKCSLYSSCTSSTGSVHKGYTTYEKMMEASPSTSTATSVTSTMSMVTTTAAATTVATTTTVMTTTTFTTAATTT